ncbi:calcium-activated BK potassium channel alpha subunit-domain-containing protein [Fennellomyces sp. T-0311]|nr:calcium-activated BK potassium channel alpha subunit-domain-containing protein [Fennellomyces sp. T-0311]
MGFLPDPFSMEHMLVCYPYAGFLITRYPVSVLLSFRGLVELITSIPLLASRFLPYGQYFYVPYFLRSWVCLLRIKSALKIKVTLRMTDKPVDAIQYKQIYLVGMIVVLLYNGMAAFQYSEAIFGGNNYCVLDSLYVVVVTLSTVGYGDITPSAPMSRIVMMLLILITVAVIPSLVSDFLETMQKRDATGSQVIKGAEPFILIVGSFTAEQAKDTLDGFLNMDNIDGKLSVIFLDTKPLTDDLKLLGRNSVWGHRIQFLHSPCLNEKAMQRANARYAKAIFTISDLNASDPMKEDEHNTVRLWSLYCYTARYDVPIYSYNLSPSTAIYQKVAKEVICVRQFNQYLLALNCRCRGASTLLTNLLHQREPLNQYDRPWEAQYDDGSCNEIYTAPAAACIIGISFCRAAWVLYNEHQVILFAVKTYVPEKDSYEIILNPFRNTHIIKNSDLCFYIAQSSKEIRDIDTLSSLYVWQMVRIQEYSMGYPDDDYGSMRQRCHLTPTLPPSPSSSSLPSSPPTKRRYQITRLPSSSHSLLIGISGGGAALNMSKLSSGRCNANDCDEDEDDDGRCNDDDDDMSIAQSETSSLKCYLLDEPAERDDVIIQSAAGMRNHVIVCMHEEFINLFKFIYNLRSPHLRPEELQDIVLLCTELPSAKAFDTISSFPRVYVMEGNCRQPDDLLRAGVKRAKQVVVMSEKENPEQQGASADSAAM